MKKLWSRIERSVAQSYQEYEEAVNEAELAASWKARNASSLIGIADGAQKTWEEAKQDLADFKTDMRTKLPEPGPGESENKSRTNLRDWGLG